MTAQTASLAYRRAATQQSSVVGLVVALHDTLVGNLRRAAEAIEKNDIQTRCNELIHGFQVLQQLDAMLDMKHGGHTAATVSRFYRHVRGQMLAAQFKLSAEMLREQIAIVLDVRQAWHQLDSAPMEDRRQETSSLPSISAKGETERQEVRVPFTCAG